LESGADSFEHAGRLTQGLVIGEAEHEDAALSEEGVAKSITSLAAVVRRAVELDGELGRHAEEVREVGANRKLASERETVELTTAQVLPEHPLGGRGVIAVAAGEDGSAMKGALHTSLSTRRCASCVGIDIAPTGLIVRRYARLRFPAELDVLPAVARDGDPR
jgi:hypothetical protein